MSLKREAKLLTSSGTPEVAVNLNGTSTYIQRPPTADEIRAWGAALTNKAEWSEATNLLRQYYQLHGFGITSRNSALRWAPCARNLESLSIRGIFFSFPLAHTHI